MPPTPGNPAAPGWRMWPHLEDDDPSAWTRHHTLYMQDGTIVLLAGDIVFRTYSGVLSRHSKVFSDMSSLSSHQPPDAETYDGCPLVRLSDNPEDLAYFLEVLIDFNFFPAENEAIPFRAITGILRLATKYMVHQLRKRVIAHLSRTYVMYYDQVPGRCPPAQLFSCPDGVTHPFEILSVLRECRVGQLLPHAFLDACSVGFHALVCGNKIGDRIFCLSQEDACVALLGWKSLHAAISDAHIRIALDAAAAPCQCCPGCFYARRQASKAIIRACANTGTLPTLFFLDLRGFGVCACCNTAWEGRFLQEIRLIWDALPRHFRLPDWTVLRDAD